MYKVHRILESPTSPDRRNSVLTPQLVSSQSSTQDNAGEVEVSQSTGTDRRYTSVSWCLLINFSFEDEANAPSTLPPKRGTVLASNFMNGKAAATKEVSRAQTVNETPEAGAACASKGEDAHTVEPLPQDIAAMIASPTSSSAHGPRSLPTTPFQSKSSPLQKIRKYSPQPGIFRNQPQPIPLPDATEGDMLQILGVNPDAVEGTN